jgi:hypothetical protein
VGIQDHCTFPNSSLLSEELKKRTFANQAKYFDQTMCIFQIHLAMKVSLYELNNPHHILDRLFKSIELQWTERATNWHSSLSLVAVIMEVPESADYHLKYRGPTLEYLELVVCCMFFMSHTVRWDTHKARFVIWAGGEVATFPLEQVLHFPNLVRYFSALLTSVQTPN